MLIDGTPGHIYDMGRFSTIETPDLTLRNASYGPLLC